ncbi:hypothetical protein JHK82_039264 [Glycine max]|nr:hypothetical protein JHK86_039442 [Glycine max]KAG4965046.1 hypothetical protein JHK85_040021 [Glycine max]KAG5110041.1 hypothetical protein JHK82_039264 [Glycine max]KAG5121328.1 hypothetical protein JHK84_039668 [Glycine max]
MENTIQFLKKTLEEKDQEMQIARCFVAQTLEENEAKWRNMLSEKGKQITNFETKLSNGAYAFGNEILALKQRVQDLEPEFCEKHKLSKDAGKIDLKELTTAIMCNIILLKKSLETKASSFKYDINSQDELDGRRIRANNAFQNEVESEETNKLISDNVIGRRNHVQDDMKFHDLKKDSQNLMSKDVVRNLSFESSDDEDNALFGLKVENVQLFERMLGFEAEMRHLIEEKESTHLALENYENVVKNLQAEIRRMEALNESQKVELKRKWESMQKKWI